MHRSVQLRHCGSAEARAVRRGSVVVATAVLAMLAACGGSHEQAQKSAEAALADARVKLESKATDGMVHIDPLSISADGVRIERKGGGPEALVTPDGALRIEGKDIAVTPEQRALLVTYYESARALRTHAIETGLAGVDVAKTAVGEVFSGLLKGDTSEIGAKVEASAEGVKAAAFRLCGDLETIGGIEASLGGLEAFAPYRFVDRAKIDDCRSETATAAAAPTAPEAAAAPAAPAAPPAPAAPAPAASAASAATT